MRLRKLCWSALLLISCLTLRADEAPSSSNNTSRNKSTTTETEGLSQLDYKLQPYDVIHVVVFQEPDLERQLRLSDHSVVTLPLIGAIELKGLTVGAAQEVIRDRYNKDYLVNPQVSLTVTEFSRETVDVIGQVSTPGAIQIPPDQPLTLVDAITRAGGFNRLADRKKVTLTRTGEDGRKATAIINVDDIIHSQSQDQVRLEKGDVIFVPERIL